MLIDEIKKAKIVAFKAHDSVARDAYDLLINKFMMSSIEAKAQNKELTDADVLSLLQKSIKELEEERDMYATNGRPENAKNIQHQIDALKAFLPSMMSEDEVRKAIAALPDKSIRAIMVAFKTNYAGKADMSMVSRIGKEFQGK